MSAPEHRALLVQTHPHDIDVDHQLADRILDVDVTRRRGQGSPAPITQKPGVIGRPPGIQPDHLGRVAVRLRPGILARIRRICVVSGLVSALCHGPRE